jgi:hypothetical protein
MPSSEYYRRQVDTLLILAVTTSDPELSTWCQTLAIEYKLLAETEDAARVAADPVTSARPTGEAEEGGVW